MKKKGKKDVDSRTRKVKSKNKGDQIGKRTQGKREQLNEEKWKVIFSDTAKACLQPKYSFIKGEEEECWCCKGLMHSLYLQGHPLLHILLSTNNFSKMQESGITEYFLRSSESIFEAKGIVGAEATMRVFKGKKKNKKTSEWR